MKRSTDECKGLRLRRLLHTRRRLAAAQGDDEDVARVQQQARDVIRWWPHLANVPWGEDKILRELDELASLEQTSQSEQWILQ